jgi:hypothetical protein
MKYGLQKVVHEPRPERVVGFLGQSVLFFKFFLAISAQLKSMLLMLFFFHSIP